MYLLYFLPASSMKEKKVEINQITKPCSEILYHIKTKISVNLVLVFLWE